MFAAKAYANFTSCASLISSSKFCSSVKILCLAILPNFRASYQKRAAFEEAFLFLASSQSICQAAFDGVSRASSNPCLQASAACVQAAVSLCA